MSDSNYNKYYSAPNGVDCIDIIESLNLGFSLGNAMKYIWRAGKKGDPIKDLEKAAWYIEREISRLKFQHEEEE